MTSKKFEDQISTLVDEHGLEFYSPISKKTILEEIGEFGLACKPNGEDWSENDVKIERSSLQRSEVGHHERFLRNAGDLFGNQNISFYKVTGGARLACDICYVVVCIRIAQSTVEILLSRSVIDRTSGPMWEGSQ